MQSMLTNMLIREVTLPLAPETTGLSGGTHDFSATLNRLLSASVFSHDSQSPDTVPATIVVDGQSVSVDLPVDDVRAILEGVSGNLTTDSALADIGAVEVKAALSVHDELSDETAMVPVTLTVTDIGADGRLTMIVDPGVSNGWTGSFTSGDTDSGTVEDAVDNNPHSVDTVSQDTPAQHAVETDETTPNNPTGATELTGTVPKATGVVSTASDATISVSDNSSFSTNPGGHDAETVSVIEGMNSRLSPAAPSDTTISAGQGTSLSTEIADQPSATTGRGELLVKETPIQTGVGADNRYSENVRLTTTRPETSSQPIITVRLDGTAENMPERITVEKLIAMLSDASETDIKITVQAADGTASSGPSSGQATAQTAAPSQEQLAAVQYPQQPGYAVLDNEIRSGHTLRKILITDEIVSAAVNPERSEQMFADSATGVTHDISSSETAAETASLKATDIPNETVSTKNDNSSGQTVSADSVGDGPGSEQSTLVGRKVAMPAGPDTETTTRTIVSESETVVNNFHSERMDVVSENSEPAERVNDSNSAANDPLSKNIQLDGSTSSHSTEKTADQTVQPRNTAPANWAAVPSPDTGVTQTEADIDGLNGVSASTDNTIIAPRDAEWSPSLAPDIRATDGRVIYSVESSSSGTETPGRVQSITYEVASGTENRPQIVPADISEGNNEQILSESGDSGITVPLEQSGTARSGGFVATEQPELTVSRTQEQPVAISAPTKSAPTEFAGGDETVVIGKAARHTEASEMSGERASNSLVESVDSGSAAMDDISVGNAEKIAESLAYSTRAESADFHAADNGDSVTRTGSVQQTQNSMTTAAENTTESKPSGAVHTEAAESMQSIRPDAAAQSEPEIFAVNDTESAVLGIPDDSSFDKPFKMTGSETEIEPLETGDFSAGSKAVHSAVRSTATDSDGKSFAAKDQPETTTHAVGENSQSRHHNESDAGGDNSGQAARSDGAPVRRQQDPAPDASEFVLRNTQAETIPAPGSSATPGTDAGASNAVDAPNALGGLTQTAGSGTETQTMPSTVELSQPGATTETYERVIDTIVRQARFMNVSGMSRADIRLEPPSLGRIRLEIVTGNSRVTGKITVEKVETKEIIESRITELKTSLAQNGLKVESFDVEIGHNGGTDAWANREDMERNFRNITELGDGNTGREDMPTENIGRARSSILHQGMVDLWI